MRNSYVNHEQSDGDEEDIYSQGDEECYPHANQTDGFSSQDSYSDQGMKNKLIFTKFSQYLLKNKKFIQFINILLTLSSKTGPAKKH